VKAPQVIVKDRIVVTKLKQNNKKSASERMVGSPTRRVKSSAPAAFSTQTSGTTNWKHAGSCRHPEESIDGIVITGSQPLTVGEHTDTLSTLFLDASLATTVNGNLIPLNPDFLNGPLAAQANYRTKYVFTDVEIEYTPAVATTFSGMFGMAIFEDCYLNAPTDFPTTVETNPSISTQYWKNFILRYKYRGTRLWFTEALTTTVADRRQTEQANITAYPLTAATATGTFGFFTIRYRVELYGPISSQGFTVMAKSREEKALYKLIYEQLKVMRNPDSKAEVNSVFSPRKEMYDEESLRQLIKSIDFPALFEPLKETLKVEASSATGLKVASAVETGLKIANGTISGVKQELMTDLNKIASTAVSSTAGALNTISDVTKLGGNLINQTTPGALAIHNTGNPLGIDISSIAGNAVDQTIPGKLTVYVPNIVDVDISAISGNLVNDSTLPINVKKIDGTAVVSTSGQLRVLGDIDKISGNSVGNAWPVDITKTKSTFLPTTSVPVVVMTSSSESSSLCEAHEGLEDYLLLDLKSKNISPDILARIKQLISGSGDQL
jgi:hypothetical protein